MFAWFNQRVCGKNAFALIDPQAYDKKSKVSYPTYVGIKCDAFKKTYRCRSNALARTYQHALWIRVPIRINMMTRAFRLCLHCLARRGQGISHVSRTMG